MLDIGLRVSLVAAVVAAGLALAPGAHAATCQSPAGVVAENARAGAPASQWDISGAGSASIQGFATDISVGCGETVQFKVDTDATAYRLDIYRMGWYGGDGARLVATVPGTPRSQPACARDAATGLVDCGDWAVSASWTVPVNATSGIYFAHLVREDGTPGESHIVFVVRDDGGGSDLLFQTSDTTWQAYNRYGGNSLYVGGPGENPSRAYKVSYNRPVTTRDTSPEDWVFNAEYPMVRWLERNGYDVSYTTGVDSDRRGAEIRGHRAFLSVGHDEYWSGAQRANVEAARDAGVNLAFLSGNESFWKTRWEDDHRTLVSYKETHANAKIDPTPTWTGSWRDPRPFNPEGGRPENAMSGTIFTVNSGSAAIQVPADDGLMRLWRNTSVGMLAPGAVATLAADTIGYEWDEDVDNGARPAGLVRLSSTTVDGVEKLIDYGSTYASGTATHHLTLYRDTNGAGPDALVFGAGTVQWPWGLDGDHDRGGSLPDVAMQQATVNLLADMGAQPATRQAGLVAAAPSADTAPPTTAITSPAAGVTVGQGSPVTVAGSATDAGGGRVGAVEVSVDGGNSWHPATGRESWSYRFTPSGLGAVELRARAADDSGNLGAPSARSVAIGTRACPCSLFDAGAAPSGGAADDGQPIEAGVRFRPEQDGVITALRYYRASGWSGTPVGRLWSAAGEKLAEVAFDAGTGTGWHQAVLSRPVPVSAGATYVASYFSSSGSYAVEENAFAGGLEAAPLHAPADGEGGQPNGVFIFGAGGGFPTQGFGASNYWADVVFASADGTAPAVVAVSPGDGSTGVSTATSVAATFSEPVQAATVNAATFRLSDAAGTAVAGGVAYDAASRTATLTPRGALAAGRRYTATVEGVRDAAGNLLAPARSWSFTTAAAAPAQVPAGGDGASGEPGESGRGAPAGGRRGGRSGGDRTGPRVRVRPHRLRLRRGGIVRLRVSCPDDEARCRVRLRLRLGRRTVAGRTLPVRGGATRTFRLRLSRAGRRAVRRHRSVRLTAVATARDQNGNRAVTRTVIRLRPGGRGIRPRTHEGK